MANLLMVRTADDSPVDTSGVPGNNKISDFLSLQSLTNFSVMTGGISAVWHGLQKLDPSLSTIWVPFAMACGWGIASLLMSLGAHSFDHDVPKKGGAGGTEKKLSWGQLAPALFVGFINVVTLFSAVVGVSAVVE